MIELNWTLFMQMVNFLILLFILNQLLFKPILRIIDERKAKVNGAFDEVRRLEGSSEEKLKLYQEQIQTARIKALSQKEGIKVEGVEAARRLLDQVKEETDRVFLQAKERIEKESTIAREALRRQSEEMAVGIAEKLIGRSLR